MRRSEREITAAREIESILESEGVGRLGLSLNDRPYVVPVNFGYQDGVIYIHSAAEGQKIDMIKKNPRVCFEVDSDHHLIPAAKACDFGTGYRSVIAFGQASVVTDPAGKKEGLDVIMAQHGGPPGPYRDKSLQRVVIIRITVESMTGKKAGG